MRYSYVNPSITTCKGNRFRRLHSVAVLQAHCPQTIWSRLRTICHERLIHRPTSANFLEAVKAQECEARHKSAKRRTPGLAPANLPRSAGQRGRKAKLQWRLTLALSALSVAAETKTVASEWPRLKWISLKPAIQFRNGCSPALPAVQSRSVTGKPRPGAARGIFSAKQTFEPCPYDCRLIRRPGSDNLLVIQYLEGTSTVSVLLAITRTLLRLNSCYTWRRLDHR